MNIGDKIKMLRKHNQITQEELAEKCYVTRNAISKWENNKGVPNLESLMLLCDCFNITIDQLLKDDLLENKEENDNTKEIVSIIMNKNYKIIKLIKICLFILLLILYPFSQIILRELLYNYDPTSILAWQSILAPLLLMILAIISCFIFRKYKIAVICGFCGFIITFIIDLFINNTTNILLNIIYFCTYFLILTISYSIKYGKVLFPNVIKKQINKIVEIKIIIKINEKRKFIISIVLLMLTICIFLFFFILSIVVKCSDLNSYFICSNVTPLGSVCIFIIPILLEVIYMISKRKEYYLKDNKNKNL